MSAVNLIALLAVAAALFGTATTVLLFALNRLLGKMDAAATENKALTSANWDLKLAILELKGTAQALDRTLSSLPASIRHEGGSP